VPAVRARTDGEHRPGPRRACPGLRSDGRRVVVRGPPTDPDGGRDRPAGPPSHACRVGLACPAGPRRPADPGRPAGATAAPPSVARQVPPRAGRSPAGPHRSPESRQAPPERPLTRRRTGCRRPGRCLVVSGDEETGLIGAGEVVEQLGQGVVEHRDRQERRVGEGQRHSGRDDRRAMPHRRPDVGLDPGRDRVRRRRRRHRAAERDSAAGPRGAGRHRGRRRRRRASARRRPLVRRPPPHRRSTTSRPCPAR
jgi:hypothetical protein